MNLYAELDANKKVLRVIVADSIDWPRERLGGTWVEASTSDPTQQQAGPGMYDAQGEAPMRFVSPWRQPGGVEDAYPEGAWVWHAGRAWESLAPDNMAEPGVGEWR